MVFLAGCLSTTPITHNGKGFEIAYPKHWVKLDNGLFDLNESDLAISNPKVD